MQAPELARVIAPWGSNETSGLTSHLVLAIRHAIGAGLLQAGDRLPPERALAEALHVSRPTISAVMHELRESGFVSSRQGSGSWVTKSPPAPTTAIPFVELLHSPGLIDLAIATAADASHLPHFRIDTTDLLGSEPATGLNPIGLYGLRADIAARTAAYVPSVTAENVMVTSGAHQALALLVATLVPRGATVLVEDTTYGGLIDIVQSNGARAIGIERDDDGPIPSKLAAALKQHEPAMSIIVASVHSPTGRVSSTERCEELAEILTASTGHVVIDETYADLEFAPSHRNLSRLLGPRTIRTGSLSKVGWLGLRTGWLVAEPAICAAITRQRWSQFDLGPPVPSQLIARTILENLDVLVTNRRKQLLARSQWLVDAIRREFPDWEVSPPHGGLALWARLPGEDSAPFVEQAASRGVALLPGWACRADRGVDPHVRICFDRPIELLAEAMGRLGVATSR